MHKNSSARKNIACLSRTHAILINPDGGGEKNSRKGREETFDHPVTVWLTTKKREQKKKDNPSFTTREISREGIISTKSHLEAGRCCTERTLFRHSSIQSTGKTFSSPWHCWSSATWRISHMAHVRLFLYASRYVMKFSTRWRWITHDDRLEAGPFREKITAARSTPDRFVKNAEGIVVKKRRRDACTSSPRISCIHHYQDDEKRRYYFLGSKRKEIYLLSISQLEDNLSWLKKRIKTASNCILEEMINKFPSVTAHRPKLHPLRD